MKQTYRLPTVQCLCIPADGSRSMLVPVMSNTMTTLASGDAFITTRDLAYMPFVNVHSEWPTLFPNENDQIIVVERFPPTSRAPSPFRFVIFMSPRVSSTSLCGMLSTALTRTGNSNTVALTYYSRASLVRIPSRPKDPSSSRNATRMDRSIPSKPPKYIS